jgi:hypothetical protein
MSPAHWLCRLWRSVLLGVDPVASNAFLLVLLALAERGSLVGVEGVISGSSFGRCLCLITQPFKSTFSGLCMSWVANTSRTDWLNCSTVSCSQHSVSISETVSFRQLWVRVREELAIRQLHSRRVDLSGAFPPWFLVKAWFCWYGNGARRASCEQHCEHARWLLKCNRRFSHKKSFPSSLCQRVGCFIAVGLGGFIEVAYADCKNRFYRGALFFYIYMRALFNKRDPLLHHCYPPPHEKAPTYPDNP